MPYLTNEEHMLYLILSQIWKQVLRHAPQINILNRKCLFSKWQPKVYVVVTIHCTKNVYLALNFRQVEKLFYIYRSWYFLKTVLHCSCVCIYTVTGRASMCTAHTRRSEERLWHNFSLSTFTWAPEFKFRSLAWAASTFSAESTLWLNLMVFEKYGCFPYNFPVNT